MQNELYIGIDGGATKCVIRIEDENGQLIARETAGPANIRISVTQSWQTIMKTLDRMLNDAGIARDNTSLRVGMGIAGCEIKSAYDEFINQPHDFSNLTVTTDAHVACLGAHAGLDGAVIVIGTGVCGYAIHNNKVTKVSGWGFPHDDLGAGAWLGLQATSKTLQAMDGRMTPSRLTQHVLQRFNQSVDQLVAWANCANSTAFAELAPLVIKACKERDETALAIMHEAAEKIVSVGNVFPAHIPIAILGGIAQFIQPYLLPYFKNRLVVSRLTPEQGAILLARTK